MQRHFFVLFVQTSAGIIYQTLSASRSTISSIAGALGAKDPAKTAAAAAGSAEKKTVFCRRKLGKRLPGGYVGIGGKKRESWNIRGSHQRRVRP